MVSGKHRLRGIGERWILVVKLLHDAHVFGASGAPLGRNVPLVYDAVLGTVCSLSGLRMMDGRLMMPACSPLPPPPFTSSPCCFYFFRGPWFLQNVISDPDVQCGRMRLTASQPIRLIASSLSRLFAATNRTVDDDGNGDGDGGVRWKTCRWRARC